MPAAPLAGGCCQQDGNSGAAKVLDPHPTPVIPPAGKLALRALFRQPLALRSFGKRPDAKSIPDFEVPVCHVLRLRSRLFLYDGAWSPANLDHRFIAFAMT